jgi:hypothetical protein
MILEPPFTTIGVLGIDNHIPENRRQKLAQSVNGQLVGAAANWVRGEEMSIDKLVGANRVDGKTQISVISLAHITDFEDQSFVVAQIAFAINAWMRKQGSAPGAIDLVSCSSWMKLEAAVARPLSIRHIPTLPPANLP